MALGHPMRSAYAEIIQKCDTAEQARDMFLSLGVGVGIGLNNHFVDTSGHAYVVEYTPAVHAVRKPGDFGEKNYLLATNGFLCKAMQPAMYTGPLNGGWYDWLPRYNTEQKLIKENYGQLTAGKLMAILGCHDYWDGKKWHSGRVVAEAGHRP